ncbi:hypothetical protein GQ44DRAFT_655921 [Phaeosphaeriaceae sp. PMI808]|nr:hypothetical protein GQ44DRAFT_655921 [Phaeosphaeriaceae sp. PMI808]
MELDPSLIPSVPSRAALNNAHAFAGATIALHLVAVVVFGGRMWSRSYPVLRMSMDDYVCILAYILVLISSILLLMTVPYTFGHDPNTFSLSDGQYALRYIVIAQPLWAWSMATIKISFALMLLRIEQAVQWRRFLWVMIVVLILMGVYNTLTTLVQCLPIYKAWDLVGTVPGLCWSKKAQSTNAIAVSVFNIITDFIFAILPINFLRKIQRPVRERLIIGALMGLAVFASIASIMKLTVAAQFGRNNDPVNENVKIGMWSVIEELVGFIVICVPCLRMPFHRVVEIFREVNNRAKQYRKRRNYSRSQLSNDAKQERNNRSQTRSPLAIRVIKIKESIDPGFKLGKLRNDSSIEEGPWESSVKGPVEIWCTKEVMVDHDRLSRMHSLDWPNRGADAVWTDGNFSLKDLQMGRAV